MDISQAKGLHLIIHRAPSTLGLDAIQQSKKRLPEAFLRGVGVAEELISFLSATVEKTAAAPFDLHKLLLQGLQVCNKLHKDLQQSGIRCWLAAAVS